MRRRQLLRSLALLAASSATSARGSRVSFLERAADATITSPPTLTTGLPLRRLTRVSTQGPELRATLVAAPDYASIVPGGPTELWCYNGEYPGPIVELQEGQRATLTFQNQLSIESTVHWHGLPVPPDQDGSPMDPVAPRGERVYAFDIAPGTAGTYWYHPHAHRTTTSQVAHGLAAPLIVVDPADPLRALPIAERTLMITALALDASGRVAVPSATGMPVMPMLSHDLLVNGQKMPVLTVAPGATERWRILNATADRFLRLSLEGRPFAVVGTDGGLLGSPLVGVTEWLLAPAQRVELVVTLDRRPAAQFALRDRGYADGMMDSGAGRPLMVVRTTTDAPRERVVLPSRLREIASLGTPSAAQNVLLSVAGMGMMSGSFLINGKTFDMNRVDLTSLSGRVERWTFTNATPMDHPMHIHGTQFQVVSRTIRGIEIPERYRAWLDTVNVPAGQSVSIDVRQAMAGKRMFHCHILPHEDAGMMAILDVKPA
ncbi:MAG: multicopper oxidase family protein [Burkholderiales bacterium]